MPAPKTSPRPKPKPRKASPPPRRPEAKATKWKAGEVPMKSKR